MSFFKTNFNGILICLFEIIVGVLLLVNPIGFTKGIIISAGIILMFLGATSIIRYFCMEPLDAAKSQSLMKGLVLCLAGAFCTFKSIWFIVTFPVITLIYGVIILVAGLEKIQWMIDSIRLKKGKWYWAGISAAISMICAIVIIISPFESTAVLWMFTGVSLIVEAVFDVIGLFFENKTKKAEPASTEEVLVGEIVTEETVANNE